MLTTIVLVATALVLATLAYASTKPDSFRVARTASISAPPERIFPLINDLHAFNTWNPFMSHDPDVKVEYAGPNAGVGARHEWSGNRNIGKGALEITESVPSSRVTMKLDMLSPIEAHNTVTFTMAPNGPNTDVTWAMQGRNTMLSKVMGLFMCSDTMVGGTFDKGLADLKTKAERA